MKLLCLLLILSPVVLLGQMRPGAIADSIKANPASLKTIHELISNNKGTVIEHIQASDSSEYVTVVVRIRVVQPVTITGLLPRPITEVGTSTFETHVLHTEALPPLPVITDGYIIRAIALDAARLFTEKFTMPTPVGIIVPPFPDIILQTNMAPLSLCALTELVTERSFGVTMDTIAIPVFEERKMPVAEMHLSDEGYSLLEKLEGFSPNLYALKDGGLTIGFGFFVPYHEGRMWNKGITWEEAERMIRQKVPQYEDQVKQYINVPLTQNEFDALTMIAYNLGGFSKATSIVNDINNEADFEQLQKDWMRFVHSKAPGVMKGLMNRRKDELKVRGASDYQPERKIQILKNIK